MTKSSLHFPVDRTLPKALVKKLIAVRLVAGRRALALSPLPQRPLPPAIPGQAACAKRSHRFGAALLIVRYSAPAELASCSARKGGATTHLRRLLLLGERKPAPAPIAWLRGTSTSTARTGTRDFRDAPRKQA